MESVTLQNPFGTLQCMTSLSANLRFPLLLRASTSKLFSSAPLLLPTLSTSPAPSPSPSPSPAPAESPSATVITDTPPPLRNRRVRGGKEVLSQAQLKENWLKSLSYPSLSTPDDTECISGSNPSLASAWVIGIDPDVSGAVALLKPDRSAHVFDSPHLKILVGKRLRKRLDARSIVQLLQSFDAPRGTTAYIEQSLPYPKDGKQGWWSSGFGYGLWIGTLVASGYSVVPVASLAWKNEFKLCGSNSSKDDSRKVASSVFPSMSALLKRKKDHDILKTLLGAAFVIQDLLSGVIVALPCVLLMLYTKQR